MRHTVTGGAGGGAKACSGAAADERGGTEQARAEKLTLLVADNSTGYFGVAHQPGRTKPYRAELRRGGKTVYLGSFATAEEAALCVARSPRSAEGKAAAKRQRSPEGQTRSQEGQEAELHLLQLQQAREEEEWLGVAAPAPALDPPRSSGPGSSPLERGLRRHLKAQGLARPRRSRNNK